MPTLVASLGLDSKQFERGFARSTSKVKNFARQFGLILSAGTVAAFTREMMRLVDQIDEMSLKTGLSTDAVQKLSYVVEQNKGDVNTLERALESLGSRAGRMPEKFNEWGISLQKNNGEMRSMEELFYAVSDRIAEAETQSEKLAIAQDLMSQNGRKLVPVLQLGSEKMKELAENAGLVSEKGVKAIADMNDAMAALKLDALVRMANIFSGLTSPDAGAFKLALAEILAALGKAGNALMKIFTNAMSFLNEGLTAAAGGFGAAMGGIAQRFVELIQSGIRSVGKKIGEIPGAGKLGDAMAGAELISPDADWGAKGRAVAESVTFANARASHDAQKKQTLQEGSGLIDQWITQLRKDLGSLPESEDTRRHAAAASARIDRGEDPKQAVKRAAEVIRDSNGNVTLRQSGYTSPTQQVTDPNGNVWLQQGQQAQQIAQQAQQAQQAQAPQQQQQQQSQQSANTTLGQLVELAIERNAYLQGKFKAQ